MPTLKTPHALNTCFRYITQTLLGVILCAHAVYADGLSELDQYIRTVQHGSAQFTQTVTSQSDSKRAKKSSGIFYFVRPAHFRFDYEKPFPQTTVADGKTLWVYDKALNQIIQRNQQKALASTPAALLATAKDISSLEQYFKLENEPVKDSLNWVKATPIHHDSPIQNILMGFSNGNLKRLIILDSFGQQSSIAFDTFEKARPAASLFRFVPPPQATILPHE